MTSPATYNRNAFGKIWTLAELPVEWPGYRILLNGDLDRDGALAAEELDGIDWLAFSEAVEDFQLGAGVEPLDARLGRVTLRKLREMNGLEPASPEILFMLGPDLALKPAATPVSEPPGPPLVGYSPEEQSICRLWNRYGQAIAVQAAAHGLPVIAALAVFWVEAKQAYDPATGLVIIRFEPHIFRRKTGHDLRFPRTGQPSEWRALAEAYRLDPEAALLSTSYGLPQLMGFNWPVTVHASVRDLVLAFQRSCEEQVAGFFAFVAQHRLITPIIQGDWQAFARRYNGPGNVPHYAGKLVRALKVVRILEEDGARFAI